MATTMYARHASNTDSEHGNATIEAFGEAWDELRADNDDDRIIILTDPMNELGDRIVTVITHGNFDMVSASAAWPGHYMTPDRARALAVVLSGDLDRAVAAE